MLNYELLFSRLTMMTLLPQIPRFRVYCYLEGMMTEAIYSGGPAVPSHHFVL
jgi:hypothetical protein